MRKTKKTIPAALALLLSCCLLPACGTPEISDETDISAGTTTDAVEGVADPNTGTAPDNEEEAAGSNAVSSASAEWIETRLVQQDSTLWVYNDFADGLNNFTQKAWVGDNYIDIPIMDEASQAYSGVTGIAAELDFPMHVWGGYMFANGALQAGDTVPLAGFGMAGPIGLDLTGAQKLTFYAKGETGSENIEFFMGGMGWQEWGLIEEYPDSTPKVSLGTVSLTKEWQRFEISLEGADLSCIGCGFGWVADRRNNIGLGAVRFYVDEIRYEFAEAGPNPMFLASYEFAKPGTDESIINNFAYLYDNALAVLALNYAGQYERARQIADAIVYAYEHDRYYSDGRLRNAYSSGSPLSFPGWLSGKGEEFCRLPGFYDTQSGEWYEDYNAVSTSAGNLAWAILALCEMSEHARQPEGDTQPASEGDTQSAPDAYLRAAMGIGDFVLTLKDDSDGFVGGYEGWEPDAVKVTYKSTEHNIDLVAAYNRLYDLTGEQRYGDAAQQAKAFVLSMYDEEKGCFYTGTTDDGSTINRDVLPLDCNTWAILALRDGFGDGEAVLSFVEANMATGGGYDFNDDRDGVWFEGTAQAALAYKQLGDNDKYEEILAFLNQNAEADGSITAADRDGVTTGFMVSGMDIPWNYGKRTHLGATAWLAFAQMGVNPFYG